MLEFVKQGPVIATEDRLSSRSRLRPACMGTVAVFLLIVLTVPALIRPSASGKLSFDDHWLDEINTARPDYVFLGNSMLQTRIDPSLLSARLGSDSCYLMWSPGAESAWAHQALKNIVLASVHRPKKVFLFFRDVYLTLPTHRTGDQYWWRIERLSHESEPELARAMNAARTWQEKLQYRLGLIYPVQKYREKACYLLEWLAGQMLAPGKVPYGAPVAKDYNDLFDLGGMKAVEAADDADFSMDDLEIYDFDGMVRNSLLPSMLQMAKDRGVELVFVRVQRRPSGNGPPRQPEELRRYIGKLQQYLHDHGARFYDFTGDPEIGLDDYLDGDHIRPERKARSTELFLKRMGEYFP